MKQKTDSGRRKLLKSVSIGAGAALSSKALPQQWVKPVVDSVMLPAHAAGSPQCTTRMETATITIELVSTGTYNLIVVDPGGGEGSGVELMNIQFPIVADDEVEDGCTINGSITGTMDNGNFAGVLDITEACPGETCTSYGEYNIPEVVTGTWSGTADFTEECCET